MNITKLTKFVSSLMAFTTDLDDSEDLDKNIEGIEIPGMNASVSTDIEQFNTSVIHASIYPSMNAETDKKENPIRGKKKREIGNEPNTYRFWTNKLSSKIYKDDFEQKLLKIFGLYFTVLAIRSGIAEKLLKQPMRNSYMIWKTCDCNVRTTIPNCLTSLQHERKKEMEDGRENGAKTIRIFDRTPTVRGKLEVAAIELGNVLRDNRMLIREITQIGLTYILIENKVKKEIKTNQCN
ncbi:hypothetical protein X798_04219 [Onchocerca flexuosa]|uniref:Uncharacterized protein n=1 Tax=Onchocerca flexuosa TaxID=387005 RepID=A0A238BTX1_9BILA|nr:hypothetical protein X798_04219 [Onchocerca flexuosa]